MIAIKTDSADAGREAAADFKSALLSRMVKRWSKGSAKVVRTALLAALVAAFAVPLVLTFTNSLMSESEISAHYSAISSGSAGTAESVATGGGDKYTSLRFIPDRVTLDQYYTVLVGKPQFLFMFWNSMKIVAPIIAGQIAVASLAGYAFSRFRYRGRDTLFFIYIVTMLMPFQVTLVPNFIVADRLGLLNTYPSIVLPGIFGTFGVFLLRQYMSYVPFAYSEAARVDGAGHWIIFARIIVPMCRPGMAALAILVFVDNWNMVEQPLIFLQDAMKQPLSVYLSVIGAEERGIAFAAATVYMLPMLLLALYAEKELVEGIQLSGIKG